MTAREAMDIARQWVNAEAISMEGFAGAFFTGSVLWMADDAQVPATSDVDLHVLLSVKLPKPSNQKFRYHDVIFDVGFESLAQNLDPEAKARSGLWACHFSRDNVISDPTGALCKIQEVVRGSYTRERAVLERCNSLAESALSWLDGLGHSQVYETVARFPPAAIQAATIPVLAVLGLPTARRGLSVARQVLRKWSRIDLYQTVLEALEASSLTARDVERQMEETTKAFDLAVRVAVAPYPWQNLLCEEGRYCVIDGTRKMIQIGQYREAAPYLLFIRSNCQIVIDKDAPADRARRSRQEYNNMLSTNLLGTQSDREKMEAEIRALVPMCLEAATRIAKLNPELRHD